MFIYGFLLFLADLALAVIMGIWAYSFLRARMWFLGSFYLGAALICFVMGSYILSDAMCYLWMDGSCW